MPTIAKKTEDHRRAIANALRYISAAPDVCELIIDNFDMACKVARDEGYGHCAENVLSMATSLSTYGKS